MSRLTDILFWDLPSRAFIVLFVVGSVLPISGCRNGLVQEQSVTRILMQTFPPPELLDKPMSYKEHISAFPNAPCNECELVLPFPAVFAGDFLPFNIILNSGKHDMYLSLSHIMDQPHKWIATRHQGSALFAYQDEAPDLVDGEPIFRHGTPVYTHIEPGGYLTITGMLEISRDTAPGKYFLSAEIVHLPASYEWRVISKWPLDDSRLWKGYLISKEVEITVLIRPPDNVGDSGSNHEPRARVPHQ